MQSQFDSQLEWLPDSGHLCEEVAHDHSNEDGTTALDNDLTDASSDSTFDPDDVDDLFVRSYGDEYTNNLENPPAVDESDTDGDGSGWETESDDGEQKIMPQKMTSR